MLNMKDTETEVPCNMSEICRLCLSRDGGVLPIFGEEEGGNQSMPLSFRIMACVSIEVSLSDGLPKLICQSCLSQVNTWHIFKQVCDSSQATLKEWLSKLQDQAEPEKTIEVKQEPPDDDDMIEIHDDVEIHDHPDLRESSVLLDIKQEPIEVCDVPDEDLNNIEVLDDPLSFTAADSTRQLPVIRLIKSEPIDADLILEENSGGDDVKGDDKGDTLLPDDQLSGDQHFHFMSDIQHEEKKEIKLESAHPRKKPKKRRPLTLRKRRPVVTSAISYSDYVEPEAEPEPEPEPPVLPSSKPRYFCFPAADGKQHYYCIPCGKSFPFRSYYLRHEKVHKKLHHICGFCDRQFSCKSNLDRHVRLHTGQKPYTCQDCSVGFQNRSEYMKHKTACVAFTANKEVPKQEKPSKQEKPPKQEKIPKQEKPEKVEPLSELPMTDSNSGGYSFPCYICRQTFDTISRLQIHRRSHADFRCRRCGKSFSGGIALSNHLRTHNYDGFKRYACKICKKSFSNVTSLVSHKRFHTMRGNIASKSSRTNKQPAAAIPKPPPPRQVHAEVPKSQAKHTNIAPVLKPSKHLKLSQADISPDGYSCTVCHKWVKNLSVLKRHMTTHTKLKLFSCVICNISMGYASSLHKHMRIVHAVQMSYKDIRSMFNVPALAEQEALCFENRIIKGSVEKPKKSDAEKVRSTGTIILNEEEEEEEEDVDPSSFHEYGYKCTICYKTFSNKRLLENHTKIIHMGGRAYKCNICSKLFAYKHLLIKHARLHSGEVQEGFSCNVCSKTFLDLKTLNNHKGVHTRFKYYTCPICSKSFNGLKNWEQHQMLHASNIRYRCKLCGKTFLSKPDLNEHKKMHIKLKIYTCGVCKNSYNSMSTLNSHKRRKHAGILGMSLYDDSYEDEMNDDNSCFVCNVCTKPFADSVSLNKHKLIHVKREFNRAEDVVMSSTSEKSSGSTNYVNPNWKFPCLQCQRDFPDQRSLSKHKGWHSRRPMEVGVPLPLKSKNRRLYTCGYCKRSFANSGTLSKHRRLNCPPKRIYNRNIAPADFIPEKSALHSMKTASRVPPPYVVRPMLHSVKPASYVPKSALMRTSSYVARPSLHSAKTSTHVTKQLLLARKPRSLPLPNTPKTEVVRRFPCPMCDRFFSNKKALIRHKGWHTRCPMLGKEQPSAAEPELQPPPSELQPSSPELQPSPPELQPSPPELQPSPPELQPSPPELQPSSPQLQSPLPQSPSPTPSQLQPEEEDVVPEKVDITKEEQAMLKRRTCDVCFKVYSSGSTLSRHKRLHKRKLITGIKSIKQPPLIKKEIEGKIIRTNEGLHMCRYCKKPFRFRRHLVDHERVHTGERPFSCNLCSLSFSRRAILWRHKKTHSGIRPFSCAYCPKTFLMNFQLTRHIAEKHTVKDIYACYRCDKTFRYELALRKHEVSQHPE